MPTKLARIDLSKANIETRVKQKCDSLEAEGFRLVAAFEDVHQLVLIFQSAGNA